MRSAGEVQQAKQEVWGVALSSEAVQVAKYHWKRMDMSFVVPFSTSVGVPLLSCKGAVVDDPL